MQTDYQTELRTAKDAALKAAEIIRYYDKNRLKLNVAHKAKHDLVTKADVEAELAIITRIKEQFPDDAFLGEETSDISKLTDARTWIIDPIDGTTNFTHAFPVYCVSIGLWVNKEPVCGVVYEVNRGELFSAFKGGGAYLNDQQINVSIANKPEEALLGTGFPYRDLSLIDDYLTLFRKFMEETRGLRRPGSACYDLACVAAGRLDGFFEYALAPWDVGAGSLLIREAGGVVTDWNGQENWLFGKRIVCGNRDIHSYLLQAITAIIPENLRSRPATE